MLTMILLLLAPFTQLGTGYYTSVGALMLVIALLQWRPVLATGAKRGMLLLGGSVLIVLPILAYGSRATTSDMLRCVREAVFYIVLISAIIGFSHHRAAVPPRLGLLLALVGCICLLVTLQTLSLGQGVYLGIPRWAYATGRDTIASDLALKYGASDLRAAGTFSEPSYLGFFLLSLAMTVAPLLSINQRARLILGIIVITGLLSRSLSFLLGAVLVLFVPVLLATGGEQPGKRLRGRKGALVLPAVLAVATLALTSAGRLLSRLGSAMSLDTADSSTSGRIFAPLAALPGFLAEHPFGVPFSILLREIYTFVPYSMRPTFNRFSVDNAFLNFFFFYGILAVPILLLIMVAAREWRLRFYLLVCMMFNGSFLTIDKLAIIMMTLCMYEGSKRYAAVYAARHPERVWRRNRRPIAPARSPSPALKPQ